MGQKKNLNILLWQLKYLDKEMKNKKTWNLSSSIVSKTFVVVPWTEVNEKNTMADGKTTSHCLEKRCTLCLLQNACFFFWFFDFSFGFCNFFFFSPNLVIKKVNISIELVLTL